MSTLLLLVASNIFMKFAWYGHLKFGHDWPLWRVIPVSWGIAVFEYCQGSAAFFAFPFKAPAA